jgi:hypothetical protein
MVLVRAPLDLVATASRFVLDELAHVEICARLAMELGGAAPLWHDPRKVIHEGNARLSPLLEAADLVVRNYCVEESIAASHAFARAFRTSRCAPNKDPVPSPGWRRRTIAVTQSAV